MEQIGSENNGYRDQAWLCPLVQRALLGGPQPATTALPLSALSAARLWRPPARSSCELAKLLRFLCLISSLQRLEFDMTASVLKCRRSAGRTERRSTMRAAIAVPLAIIGLAVLANPGAGGDRLAQYAYKDTQDLVSLVEDAAALIEAKGDEAFKDFAQRDSKWLNADHYLFAYTLEGVTVFHPVTPALTGQSVMDLKDMNGKPIIRQITNIGKRPRSDASGWVFYLWEDHTQLTPSWKATYVRKAITPDHQTYVVGSGSYSIKVEKAFVEFVQTFAARTSSRPR
jgi:hypothetical protein